MPEHIYSSDGPSPESTEFATAIKRYQRTRHRRYPTFLEVLAVLRSLGYRKVCPPDDLPEYRTGRRLTGR
jgi:hypothetical protein